MFYVCQLQMFVFMVAFILNDPVVEHFISSQVDEHDCLLFSHK